MGKSGCMCHHLLLPSQAESVCRANARIDSHVGKGGWAWSYTPPTLGVSEACLSEGRMSLLAPCTLVRLANTSCCRLWVSRERKRMAPAAKTSQL
mmetsp:Transcript_17333/g.48296  ORF Transcript_17333/g.48296 Transcript_17333/m.48296 type:complete len:95 (-) Transcript_17333:236-520(-)